MIRLGNQLLREKRFSEGLQVLERNIDLYPDQPESYWHVGDAYILSGKPHKARAFLEAAVQKARAMGLADIADYETSLAGLEPE